MASSRKKKQRRKTKGTSHLDLPDDGDGFTRPREDFVSVLKNLSPALGNAKSVLPIFSCFCLTGKTIITYNDVVGMEYPFTTPIAGGLMGETLLGVLSASKARDLVFTHSGSTMTIKAARTRLKMSLQPVEDFVFQFPKLKGSVRIEVDAVILEALSKCAVSMGLDPSRPERMGVSLRITKANITMYSSDTVTASMVDLGIPVIGYKRNKPLDVVLPPQFCRILGDKHAEGEKLEGLAIAEDFVVATFQSGLRLFTRTVAKPNIKEFTKVFSKFVTDDVLNVMVDVPKGFKNAIDRAIVIAGAAKKKSVSLYARNGKLIVEASSAVGDVKDSLRLPDHGEAEGTYAVDTIARCIPYVAQLCIVDKQCVVFGGGYFTHVIAALT